jgi:hypothetical protein
VYAASDIVILVRVRHRFRNCIVETSDFIPSPNVAEDHQKNAKSMSNRKGLYEGI